MIDLPQQTDIPVRGKNAWQEPWFWMVLGPLLVSIVTSLVFVYISVKGADQRVVDDYYSEGKMINHRFEADKLAASLGVSAEIAVDLISGEVIVDLTGLEQVPNQLTLQFSHPVKSSDDIAIILKHINTSRYRADLPQALAGRWYVQLLNTETNAHKKWRLMGEMDLNRQQTLQLTAEVK